MTRAMVVRAIVLNAQFFFSCYYLGPISWTSVVLQILEIGLSAREDRAHATFFGDNEKQISIFRRLSSARAKRKQKLERIVQDEYLLTLDSGWVYKCKLVSAEKDFLILRILGEKALFTYVKQTSD